MGQQEGTGSTMSPHFLLASLILLPASSQAAAAQQERGLFGDVLGGILGGGNATNTADAAADAAPSDVVGTLMQVIPTILSSNGSLPMDQIGSSWHQKGANCKPFHQAGPVCSKSKSGSGFGSSYHHEYNSNHRSRCGSRSSPGSPANLLWQHVH